MSKEYVIFVDVSADVDATFATENNIHFIPMNYTLGEEQRECDFLEDEDVLVRFYNGQRGGDFTKTSQINPHNYQEQFEPYAKAGMSVLYISLSSGLSGTFQSAMIAAEELMDEYDVSVVPVDSLCATAGMGLMIEAAVANQKKGMSVEENADWLNQNKQRINHWFMVEDLMYLKRGGRVSAATALVGTTLNIKPILEINHVGKLVNIDKKRGVKGALKGLLKLYEQSIVPAEDEFEDHVYIVHADCGERADLVETMLKEVNPKCSVSKMMLSPIIGAHTGPGMLAVIHWGKERKQDEA